MKLKFVTLVLTFLLPWLAFSQNGNKYILLEEFSTAQCGFCPDGDIVAAQLVKQYPRLIWVTHHAGFGTDSMTANGSNTIANAFTTFAPGACIDRVDAPIPVYTIQPYIAISRQKWDSVCAAHYSDPAIANVNIINHYDSNSRILNCEIQSTFLTVPKKGDIRVNLYLVEDSVVGFGHGYDQKSYFNTTPGHPLYGKGDTVIGYVHHRVVRAIPTTAWGLSGVVPATIQPGLTYSHSFTNISIPAKWKASNMEVVAFISYYNDTAKKRQVINSNHKKLLEYNTGILINEVKNSCSIIPNPVSSFFSLNQIEGNGEIKTVELMNPEGKVVEKWVGSFTGNNTFSIKNLENGLYFYKVVSKNEQISTGKIVIIH